MKQPEGTVTYKGRRKSRPGQESLAKGQKEEAALNKAAEFHAEGKAKEAKSTGKTKDKAETKVDKEAEK